MCLTLRATFGRAKRLPAVSSFSLLVQRKPNQKKAHPTIWSLRDYPALLAFIGAKINSLRSNKFLLNPMKTAMLGCIEGMKTNNPSWQHCCFYPPLRGEGWAEG
jgi:hypothetical protein